MTVKEKWAMLAPKLESCGMQTDMFKPLKQAQLVGQFEADDMIVNDKLNDDDDLWADYVGEWLNENPAWAKPEWLRRKRAEELLEEHDNNGWDGSSSIEELAASKFAVIVERDDDGWVLHADSLDDVAGIELGTMTGTEGYDEWVDCVVDLDTGKTISYRREVVVTILQKDKVVGTSSNS